jgi:hypothetical protein
MKIILLTTRIGTKRFRRNQKLNDEATTGQTVRRRQTAPKFQKSRLAIRDRRIKMVISYEAHNVKNIEKC